jgi:lipase chaperone LimK
MPLPRHVVLGAGTVVLALLAFFVWRISSATHGQPESTTTSSATQTMPSSPATAAGAAGSDLPASQRGTRPDGGVRVDNKGLPITDAELRRYFDWYLAAIGEQELPIMRARLARDLSLRATSAQAAAVLAWFDRYVAYQRASTQLAGITDLRQRLDAVHELREKMLVKAEADGFFGEEENEASRVLALKRIQADPGMDAAEREAIERGLQARSPGYAEARHESELRQQLGELDAELDRQGATANERRAERSALLGPEAADRFAELDRARADWNARLQDYSRQRAALQARTGLSENQRLLESRRLLASFSPAEQRRLAALQEAGLLH